MVACRCRCLSSGGRDPLRLETGEHSFAARETVEHQGHRLRQLLPLEQKGTIGFFLFIFNLVEEVPD